MKFKLENTFEDNLALFQAEAEQIDPECAKILVDNLHLLDSGGDTAPSRATSTVCELLPVSIRAPVKARLGPMQSAFAAQMFRSARP